MKFEVESGGVRYEVEAPDEQSAIDALQGLIKSAPKASGPNVAAGPVKTAETSVMGDVTKAAGSGLVTGTEALLGLPGDLTNLAHQAGGWAGRGIRSALGMPPKPADAPSLANPLPLPATTDVASANKAVTGFEPYQPTTTAGKFARTAAEFVPGAAAFGGGGVASNALKYGVVPGVASEAAGQLTEGTPYEVPARIGAAVVAAGGVNALTRPKPPASPTAADLKTQGGALYKSLDTPQGQVVLEPAAFTRIANDVSSAAYKARISNASPKAFAVLKEIENMAAPGIAPDMMEIEGLRRQLSALAKSPEGTERFFAALMREKLDDAINALKPADVISGDPAAAMKTLTDARSLWQRAKKVDLIDDLMERAKDAAGANYTSAGLMTAVRQKFRALAGRSDFKALFNSAERDAIRQIVRGTKTDAVIRILGKLDPRSPLMGILTGGIAVQNPVLGGAMAATGIAGKALASRAAQKSVDKLSQMVATGAVPPTAPSGLNVPLATFYGSAELNRPRYPMLENPSGLTPVRGSRGEIIGFAPPVPPVRP